MNIEEFGIALGVWQREELETPAYQTAVRDFPEDVLIYWPRSALLEPHTRVASPKSHVFFCSLLLTWYSFPDISWQLHDFRKRYTPGHLSLGPYAS